MEEFLQRERRKGHLADKKKDRVTRKIGGSGESILFYLIFFIYECDCTHWTLAKRESTIHLT